MYIDERLYVRLCERVCNVHAPKILSYRIVYIYALVLPTLIVYVVSYTLWVALEIERWNIQGSYAAAGEFVRLFVRLHQPHIFIQFSSDT